MKKKDGQLKTSPVVAWKVLPFPPMKVATFTFQYLTQPGQSRADAKETPHLVFDIQALRDLAAHAKDLADKLERGEIPVGQGQPH